MSVVQVRPSLQTLPQEPQLETDVRLVSHPFAVFPSQSAKLAAQKLIAHTPLLHFAVAFGSEQTLPQEPQLDTVLSKLVSHPFAVLPSQLPKPVLQLEILQLPFIHTATPFAIEQTFPHAPQFVRDELVLISHPSTEDPLQFAVPAGQSMLIVTRSEVDPQGLVRVHFKE
jgi:hypothetical protein